MAVEEANGGLGVPIMQKCGTCKQNWQPWIKRSDTEVVCPGCGAVQPVDRIGALWRDMSEGESGLFGGINWNRLRELFSGRNQDR